MSTKSELLDSYSITRFSSQQARNIIQEKIVPFLNISHFIIIPSQELLCIFRGTIIFHMQSLGFKQRIKSKYFISLINKFDYVLLFYLLLPVTKAINGSNTIFNHNSPLSSYSIALLNRK